MLSARLLTTQREIESHYLSSRSRRKPNEMQHHYVIFRGFPWLTGLHWHNDSRHAILAFLAYSNTPHVLLFTWSCIFISLFYPNWKLLWFDRVKTATKHSCLHISLVYEQDQLCFSHKKRHLQSVNYLLLLASLTVPRKNNDNLQSKITITIFISSNCYTSKENG